MLDQVTVEILILRIFVFSQLALRHNLRAAIPVLFVGTRKP